MGSESARPFDYTEFEVPVNSNNQKLKAKKKLIRDEHFSNKFFF